MKNSLALLLIFGFFIISCAQNNGNSENDEDSLNQEDVVSTYYFIRHAEKNRTDETNSDPHLNAQGKKRAEKWSEELSNVKFDAIYSTDYNRTKETATPLAHKNGLELIIYDPSDMNNPSFLEATRGKTVLVVGHSNTTPMFANAILGREKYEEMDDRNNANIYIVTVKNNSATAEMRRVN